MSIRNQILKLSSELLIDAAKENKKDGSMERFFRKFTLISDFVANKTAQFLKKADFVIPEEKDFEEKESTTTSSSAHHVDNELSIANSRKSRSLNNNSSNQNSNEYIRSTISDNDSEQLKFNNNEYNEELFKEFELDSNFDSNLNNLSNDFYQNKQTNNDKKKLNTCDFRKSSAGILNCRHVSETHSSKFNKQKLLSQDDFQNEQPLGDDPNILNINIENPNNDTRINYNEKLKKTPDIIKPNNPFRRRVMQTFRPIQNYGFFKT